MTETALALVRLQKYQPIVGRDGCRWVEVLADKPWLLADLSLAALYRHDLAMLAAAAYRAVGWQHSFPGLGITLNADPRHFQNPGFAPAVAGILEKTGLSPKLLKLEITEEPQFELDDPVVQETLAVFSKLGVELAVDDFGSGCTSHELVEALKGHDAGGSFTTLKLDQKFARNLTASVLAALRGIIRWAKGLKLTVVAEGVEDQRLCEYLYVLGCVVQGWVHAQKMSLEELFAWLTKRQQTLG